MAFRSPRLLLAVLVIGLHLFLPFNLVFASNSNPWGIAYHVLVEDVNVGDGNILALEGGIYRLSRKEYDDKVVGVVNTNPSLVVDLLGREDSVPMVSSGQAYVLVNGSNGPIAVGDYVAASSRPGLGMKSEKGNFVLGQALEPFPAVSPTDEGKILVMVNVQQTGSISDTENPQDVNLELLAKKSIFDIFSVVRSASEVESLSAFKYVLASLIVVCSVLFGYYTFGRVAQSGIEAIGRNPLARKTIMVGVVFNVVVSIVIILSGIVVAFFVIRL